MKQFSLVQELYFIIFIFLSTSQKAVTLFFYRFKRFEKDKFAIFRQNKDYRAI